MLQTVNKPYRQHKVTFLFLNCMLVDFNLTFVMSVQHATTVMQLAFSGFTIPSVCIM